MAIAISSLIGATSVVATGGSTPAEAATVSPLDPSYGSGGAVVAPGGMYGPPIAFSSDGRTLVSFAEGSPGKVRRYTAAGQLDSTFAPASVTPGSIPIGVGGGVEVDGSGRILTTAPTIGDGVIRYLADGSVDPAFTMDHTTNLRQFVPLANGGVVGFEIDGTTSTVLRFLPSGALDTSFNSAGTTPGTVDLDGITVADLQPLADGGLVLAGSSAPDHLQGVVIRLTPTGERAPGFQPGAAMAGVSWLHAVAVDNLGRYVVAEAAPSGTRLHRLLADGRRDVTFGHGGVAAGPPDLFPRDMVIDGAGRVLVGGSHAGEGAVFRLTAEGRADVTFSTGGVPAGLARFEISGEETTVNRVFALADGRVMVAGYLGPLSGGPRSEFAARLLATSTATTGAGFNPVPPNRILDTRNGIGGQVGRLVPGQPLRLAVAGTPGLPASGVGAVTMNVTAVQPLGPGFVTVFPCDIPEPVVSNLNFSTGQDVPNLVTVPVASDGTVCLSASAPTHLLTDVAGWYGSFGAGFTSVAPNRVLDTRTGVGQQGVQKLAPGQILRLRVAGTPSVPLSGASAVTMNVTVTRSEDNGYLTVFPCNIAQPVVSNLNFAAGHDIANLVTVPLPEPGWWQPDHGTVCITSSATIDVLADVAGWFGETGAGFNPVPPNRILDTRLGLGAPVGPLPPGRQLRLTVRGTPNIPTNGVSAVTLNVTVTQPQHPGFVTVFPCGIAEPVVSNLNFGRGQDVPNLVTVPVGADGTICITSSATTNLIADIAGWYSDD